MLHVVPSIPKWGNGYIPLPSTTVLELEAVEAAEELLGSWQFLKTRSV